MVYLQRAVATELRTAIYTQTARVSDSTNPGHARTAPLDADSVVSTNQYEPWARKNCALRCGFCGEYQSVWTLGTQQLRP